jgi:Uma2 family endonuclease
MKITQRDTEHHTYGEYLMWPDDQRAELIDGICYVREPPSPTCRHQDLVLELSHQIRGALEGKPARLCLSPLDVRLPSSDEADEEIDTVVQPDLFIVCDGKRLETRGLRGAPDWLVEVLSPGTATHDLTRKLPVYERAGVREVWLVHPTDLILTVYRLEEGRYGCPTTQALKGQTSLTAVPGVTIDWDRLVAQLE